jgi:very-short-patch-repair endonuclease
MAQAPLTPEPDSSIDQFVRTVVQQYRLKLLDLSSRNPLINFRHSEKSRTHIRVVNEVPEILFNKLEANKQLTFDPLKEPNFVSSDESTAAFEADLRRARQDPKHREAVAQLGPSPSDRQKRKLDRQLRDRVRQDLGMPEFEPNIEPRKRALELGISPEYDLPAHNGQTSRHFNDLKIQTLFYQDDLVKKLGGLRDSARVLLQDAGLNALYVAFGFLEYYESATSDEKRTAPLLFYPVELDRFLDDGEYRYFIRGTNVDVEVNVALAELLKTQLSLELPPWSPEEDSTDSLEQYFAAIERMIAGKPDWKLRRFVTVGLFTFSSLAMYKDLDPRRWPIGHPLEKHGILRTLVAGAEIRGQQRAEDYVIGEREDNDVLLVTEADSSQHSAVIDVLNGKNSVIQGPPGTGKSQTITNIISAALHAGKTVLFVAEKMAALEVVDKRLEAAGLKDFCLEVHSTKTSKTSVIASLASRLDYRPPVPHAAVLQSNLAALDRAKKELIYYVQKANEPAGQTGLTVQQILLGSAKREAEGASFSKNLFNARFGAALTCTPHQRADMIASAQMLQKELLPLTEASGSLRSHPWRGIGNSSLTEFESATLLEALQAWQQSLNSLIRVIQSTGSQLQVELSTTIDGVKHTCADILGLNEPPRSLVQPFFARLATDEARKCACEAIKRLEHILKSEQDLSSYTTEPKALMSFGAEGLQEVIESLRKMGVDHLSVAEVRSVRSQCSSSLDEITRSMAVAKNLEQEFGVAAPDFTHLNLLIAAAEIATELPSDLWPRRSPGLLDEANATAIKSYAERCRLLISRKKTLEAKYSLADLGAAKDLQQYAFALKTANAFTALFSADCRAAKRVARFAAKDRRKLTRLQLATELQDCARCLKDEAEFLNNKQIRDLCGIDFDGLDTRFGDLVQVSEWSRKVLFSVPVADEFGEQVRDRIRLGSAEQLMAIATVAHDPAFHLLKKCVAQMQERSYRSLTETREKLSEHLTAISRALVALDSASVQEQQTIADLSTAINLIREINNETTLLDQDDRVRMLLGAAVSDKKREVADLQRTVEYAEAIAASGIQEGLVAWVFQGITKLAELKKLFSLIEEAMKNEGVAHERFNRLAELDMKQWSGNQSHDSTALDTLRSKNERALSCPGALRDYLKFLIAEEDAADCGLGPVINAFLEDGTDYRDLDRACEFVFYRSAAEQLLNAEPRLKQHSGATHEKLRNQYQSLDREYLTLRRKLLASELANRPVPFGNNIGRVADLTELALVQHVAGQTRPRIALRDLLKRSGKAVQALKPCWMMSPMSVAQFLEQGAMRFDLVVMDEASQIRPEEALGAIARGAQLVVVGDQMQLPPTPFFQKLSVDSASDDEEEGDDVKQESILEAAAARFYPSRTLKWHYRSEHGSLIAFSNQEFYEGKLTVFPSPFHEHGDYGVKLVPVKGVYKSGTNLDEVKAITEAAVTHMSERPGQSLGIVAVNSKQSELIREEMDRVFASNPQAEAFRARWESSLEFFFVKNLENVQGDERDVIFISTVYGTDDNGNFHQRFGPINGEYGHRRLNVLFTRAKKKVVVFSSMIPEEIQDEGKRWGVRALKSYIQYARDGRISPRPEHETQECDSEFEEWVIGILRAHGLEAVPQLGFAGYRIDIAVKHPKHPGTFVCGIECDGAAYHSARSVRERDRLRQEILERLGWKIYRIWSTDWFRNPLQQTKLLLDHVNSLIK